MVRAVEQELFEKVSVCAVKLDAVKTRFLRERSAAAKLFDDVGNLVPLERARDGELGFRDVAVLVANRSAFERTYGRGGDGRDAACVGGTCLASRVPHLQEDARAVRMHGIDYACPAFRVRVRVNA